MLTLSGKIYSKFITLLVFFLLNKYFPVTGLPKGCSYDKSNNVMDCTKLSLTTIPSDVFTVKYEQIKLADNPFKCDCNITWFLDRIQSAENEKKIGDLNSLKCNSPKRLFSKLILNLNNTDVCPALLTSTTQITTNGTAQGFCEGGNKLVNTCDPTREVCVNKGKSYECRCKEGFRKKPGTTECVLVIHNACKEENMCSKHAQCINEIGTYKCICKLGYTGNGKHCEDKDECADKSHECHENAVCVNKVGGYKCYCKPGYKQLKEGRLCLKQTSIPTKTYILAVFVAGCPLVMFVLLTIFLIRRRKNRKRSRHEEGLLFDDQVDDLGKHEVVGLENQQIIGMGSFFEDVPMTPRGIPASESVWSEWADYDDRPSMSDVESDY